MKILSGISYLRNYREAAVYTIGGRGVIRQQFSASHGPVDIMERNDCDWVEFEEMYGLCQWVGINVFYIVLFRLELVSSSNVIRFYSLRQIAKSNDTFRGKKESHHYSSVHTKG